MSRRSHVVRSAVTAGPSEPIVDQEVFTWNAMLGTVNIDNVAPSDTALLSTEWWWHQSEDNDFNTEFAPHVRIVAPRDGIYSVSARVFVTADAAANGLVGLNAHTNSSAGSVIDSEMRPLTEFEPGTSVAAWLHTAHAGFPFYLNDNIWLAGENRTGSTVQMHVESFSVTYEAELGTVVPITGGV